MNHPLFMSQGSFLGVVKSLPPRERELIAHSNSVKRLATKIARKIGFDPFETRVVQFAAKMHDVAKFHPLYRPLIFNRPGKLTREEKRVVDTHAYASAVIVLQLWNLGRILDPFEVVGPGLAVIAGHHWPYNESEARYHSFLNEGQFACFTEECREHLETPLVGARILKVVDVFLASTENRYYLQEGTRPLTPEEAYAEIAGRAGTEFDPQVVEVLSEVMTLRVQPSKWITV